MGVYSHSSVLVTNRLFDICSSISSLRHAIELDPLALNSTPSYSSLVQFWLAESGAARSIALFPPEAVLGCKVPYGKFMVQTNENELRVYTIH